MLLNGTWLLYLPFFVLHNYYVSTNVRHYLFLCLILCNLFYHMNPETHPISWGMCRTYYLHLYIQCWIVGVPEGPINGLSQAGGLCVWGPIWTTEHSEFCFYALGFVSHQPVGMIVGVAAPRARTSALPSRWENMWQTLDFCQPFMRNKSDLILIGFVFCKITELVR